MCPDRPLSETQGKLEMQVYTVKGFLSVRP